jgi:hypothetical protein
MMMIIIMMIIMKTIIAMTVKASLAGIASKPCFCRPQISRAENSNHPKMTSH